MGGPAVLVAPGTDPDAFGPWATLYVHVSQDTFTGRSRGAVRVESVGPVTTEQAVDCCATAGSSSALWSPARRRRPFP